jgi:alanine racemase
VIQPSIGVLTKIGSSCLMKVLQNLKKIKEKLLLFKSAEVLIYQEEQ